MNKVEQEYHALLSPSKAKQWINCPPSARAGEAEAVRNPQPSSPYAKEGTEAHTLAEIKLAYHLDKINFAQYESRFQHFRSVSQFYDAEFNDYVNDYCQKVMDIIEEHRKEGPIEVYLEVKVPIGGMTGELDATGTSDVVIVGSNFVHVIDLKFGKGVAVSAVENEQLRIYGAGACQLYFPYHKCDEVRTTIIQPRLYDITHETLKTVDLAKWIDEVVRPAAKLAIAGQGTWCAGDHCKFCLMKGKCEQVAEYQLAAASAEFDLAIQEEAILLPQDMPVDMLARILAIGPKFQEWLNEVIKVTKARMINEGLKVPGYKLVEGRSVRKITDQAAVAEKLRTAGFAEDQLYKPVQLQSMTQLEKMVGKKLFGELCGEYLIKPLGAITVAPESDKRMALDATLLAGAEFDEDIHEDQEN